MRFRRFSLTLQNERLFQVNLASLIKKGRGKSLPEEFLIF